MLVIQNKNIKIETPYQKKITYSKIFLTKDLDTTMKFSSRLNCSKIVTKLQSCMQ